MKTRITRKGSQYTITTSDKNPATGKVDVLGAITEDFHGFNRYFTLRIDGRVFSTAIVPDVLVPDARRYFAACSLDENRALVHPEPCQECAGWIPAGQECQKCAEFHARWARIRADTDARIAAA
jgi:hypothetical protein